MANKELEGKIWKHVQKTSQIEIVPWEKATETNKMKIIVQDKIIVQEMISEARKYTRSPRQWAG